MTPHQATPDTSDSGNIAGVGGTPGPTGDTRRRRRIGKKTPKLEDLYRHQIKSGEVEIIRRRGKPPIVKWKKAA